MSGSAREIAATAQAGDRQPTSAERRGRAAPEARSRARAASSASVRQQIVVRVMRQLVRDDDGDLVVGPVAHDVRRR